MKKREARDIEHTFKSLQEGNLSRWNVPESHMKAVERYRRSSNSRRKEEGTGLAGMPEGLSVRSHRSKSSGQQALTGEAGPQKHFASL